MRTSSILPVLLLAGVSACAASAPRAAANGGAAANADAASADAARARGDAAHANADAARAGGSASLRGPRLDVLLRPIADPTPILHVEITADSDRPSLRTFRLADGAVDSLLNVSARDDAGAIEAKLAATPPGVTLTLAREPSSAVRVTYDLRANVDAPGKPLGQLVLSDRFRGSGEGALLLPEALDEVAAPIEVRIDGAAIRAPNSASSLGIGSPRRTRARGRVLRRTTFLAGAMGAASFDAAEGHDEAAWLGYTAFDPRPAAAEIAQVRSAMGEHFGSRDEPPQTLLLFAQTRPQGSFTTTARAGSILLQLGPSEPWGAALRLSVAQQMIHTWIGGELWIGPTDAEHEAESWWFTEGVARFETTRLLARLGLLTPADVRDAIAGETSVLATSPHRGKSNAALAAIARGDDRARAHLVARGALYAASVNARIRKRSKGEKSLDPVILALLARARAERHALPATAWVEALAKDDAAEARAYEEAIERGVEPVLPDGALGPCFRSGTGEYVTFDLGYDERATRESPSRVVVDLRPNGPAARGGLRAGDAIDEVDYRDGRPDVKVKMTVTRAGAKVTITYEPSGERHRGQTWTRVAGVPDDRCGDVL